MLQSHIIRVALVLLTIWRVSSSNFVPETGSESPAGIVYGRHDFKDNDEENGNMFELNLELDVSHKKTEKCAGISTDPELNRKILDMENQIKEFKRQIEEMENLKKIVKYLRQVEEIENIKHNLSAQISRVSKLEQNVLSIENESKGQAEKIENINSNLTLQISSASKLGENVDNVEKKIKEQDDRIENVNSNLTLQISSASNLAENLEKKIKEQDEIIENLNSNLTLQISRVSKLKEKIISMENESTNLKAQVDKVENQVIELQKKQDDDPLPLKIYGLYEQMMEDIKSENWNKSVQLMRRHLNQSTEAYKQLNNITEYYSYPRYTAERGYVELVRVMLDNGLPINERYIYNYTMLYSAAKYGHYKLVKFLIERDADVNLKGPYGYTPLHVAARSGHVNIVQLLVESGADINVIDEYRETPLHDAARNEHELVAEYLLNKGCNTTITNIWGKTAADVAKTPEIRAIIQGKMT